MEMETFVEQIKTCAIFFYQNKEQEAYALLNQLLPFINQVLQEKLSHPCGKENKVVSVFTQFIEAYQQMDNLALADLLEYEISNIVEM